MRNNNNKKLLKCFLVGNGCDEICMLGLGSRVRGRYEDETECSEAVWEATTTLYKVRGKA